MVPVFCCVGDALHYIHRSPLLASLNILSAKKVFYQLCLPIKFAALTTRKTGDRGSETEKLETGDKRYETGYVRQKT